LPRTREVGITDKSRDLNLKFSADKSCQPNVLSRTTAKKLQKDRLTF